MLLCCTGRRRVFLKARHRPEPALPFSRPPFLTDVPRVRKPCASKRKRCAGPAVSDVRSHYRAPSQGLDGHEVRPLGGTAFGVRFNCFSRYARHDLPRLQRGDRGSWVGLRALRRAGAHGPSVFFRDRRSAPPKAVTARVATRDHEKTDRRKAPRCHWANDICTALTTSMTPGTAQAAFVACSIDCQ
jgi:hypothetical protein